MSVCPIVNNTPGANTILHLFVNILRTWSNGGQEEPRAVWTLKWMPGLEGGVNPVFTIKTLPRSVLKFLKSYSTNFRS